MSTIRTDTLKNAAGTKSVPVSTVVDGSAKAWVNFNGQGTVAIRAAFNVSSITDNGTGDYTMNFVSLIQDGSFSALATAARDSAGGNIVSRLNSSFYGPAGVRVMTQDLAQTQTDVLICNISIFR